MRCKSFHAALGGMQKTMSLVAGGFRADIEIQSHPQTFLLERNHSRRRPKPQSLPTAFDIHRNWSRANPAIESHDSEIRGVPMRETKAESGESLTESSPFHLLSSSSQQPRGEWLLEPRRAWLQGVRRGYAKQMRRGVPAAVQFRMPE